MNPLKQGQPGTLIIYIRCRCQMHSMQWTAVAFDFRSGLTFKPNCALFGKGRRSESRTSPCLHRVVVTCSYAWSTPQCCYAATWGAGRLSLTHQLPHSVLTKCTVLLANTYVFSFVGEIHLKINKYTEAVWSKKSNFSEVVFYTTVVWMVLFNWIACQLMEV